MTYGTPCHTIGHFAFYYHHVTYRMPCRASGHLVIYRKCYGFESVFLLSGVFDLTLLPASFRASLGAGSSTSRLAGLPADLRNIAPAWLFVWITTTYKRGIDSRFMVYGWSATWRICSSRDSNSLHNKLNMPEVSCFIHSATELQSMFLSRKLATAYYFLCCKYCYGNKYYY